MRTRRLTVPDIDLKCIVNREYLQAGNKAVVYLAMDISPPAAPQTPESLKPVNVCLAIDRSGSMREENKLENAKTAAIQLIESLKPTDYASIVTFSDKEYVEVTSRPAGDVYGFQNAINNIKAGGLTDIHSALRASFDETMRQRGNFPEEPVSRIILLTDGQPTKGKDKVDEFIPLCTDIRRNNVSVTTMGVGSDYNEQLLSTIASTTGGSWYHITDPRNIPTIFSDELIEMKTVVMLKPELKIQPVSGAELNEIYKVRPMLDQIQNPTNIDGKYIIPLGDIVGGQPQNVVARFHLPPRPEGKYRIAKAELRSGKTTITQDVIVNYTNDPTLYDKETNPYPRILLMTSEGTMLFRKGVASGDETVIAGAQTVIKKTLDDPNAMTVVRTNPLVMDMVTRINKAYEATVVKKGKLSEEDKKKVLSETTVIKKNK
jgi:Ca-activated chloride channel family protein